MRVTQEADYAIRICSLLDSKRDIMGAARIAEETCITPKIALKVLRKLTVAGYIRSFKGVHGGYELTRDGDSIKIIEIIEAIDGPVRISKCLGCEHNCSKNSRKTDCKMYVAFALINKKLKENLGSITVKMLHDESMSAADIAEIINKI